MATKYLKMCSTPLSNKKLQIKSQRQYMSTRMAKNTRQRTSVNKDMEPLDFSYIADGHITWYKQFRKLAVSIRDKHVPAL